MGAGPTKEQVTNAIRSSLQKAQAEFGGSYVKGFENLSWRAAFKEAGINSVKAAN